MGAPESWGRAAARTLQRGAGSGGGIVPAPPDSRVGGAVMARVHQAKALGLVLPLALVDEMYVLLRRVRGIDPNELGRYTEQLRARMAKLAPAERFVLQRLLGLERLAAWQNSR